MAKTLYQDDYEVKQCRNLYAAVLIRAICDLKEPDFKRQAIGWFKSNTKEARHITFITACETLDLCPLLLRRLIFREPRINEILGSLLQDNKFRERQKVSFGTFP